MERMQSTEIFMKVSKYQPLRMKHVFDASWPSLSHGRDFIVTKNVFLHFLSEIRNKNKSSVSLVQL